MFQSYDLGRVFGVQLRVHGSVFLLLVVLVGMALLGQGVGAAVDTAALLVMVLGSVTLHELGHIAVARLFGNHTDGITLYPIGGVAQLTRPSRTATEEVLVALAGPAVNVVLAAFAALVLVTVGPVLGGVAGVASTFLWVNVVLALFNLVPAYPMDGGRVLRGLLWSFVGNFKATWWAARAGQGFAALFAVVGLMANPMLVLIAAFVFFQASAELARLRAMRQAGWPVDEAPRAPAGAINQPRPWTAAPRWPGDPVGPLGLRAVAVHTVHTPWGSYQEVELSDGRRVRRPTPSW
ncbi:MAG: site-2 protease family protein [Planctomycetes bacterium]|nr:site-2 protease family protein [Planctomycetota bacterium]